MLKYIKDRPRLRKILIAFAICFIVLALLGITYIFVSHTTISRPGDDDETTGLITFDPDQPIQTTTEHATTTTVKGKIIDLTTAQPMPINVDEDTIFWILKNMPIYFKFVSSEEYDATVLVHNDWHSKEWRGPRDHGVFVSETDTSADSKLIVRSGSIRLVIKRLPPEIHMIYKGAGTIGLEYTTNRVEYKQSEGGTHLTNVMLAALSPDFDGSICFKKALDTWEMYKFYCVCRMDNSQLGISRLIHDDTTEELSIQYFAAVQIPLLIPYMTIFIPLGSPPLNGSFMVVLESSEFHQTASPDVNKAMNNAATSICPGG